MESSTSSPQNNEYWENRLINDPKKDWDEEGDWIEQYWGSRFHPHRFLMIEKLRRLMPITSLLEVGCNCGPNLWVIGGMFENVRLF